MPNHSAQDSLPEVILRIPGQWSGTDELEEMLPKGCRFDEEGLHLPDGPTLEFKAMPSDNEFPEVFTSACRKPPSDEELQKVKNYKVNFCLAGPGGSLDAAKHMLKAGAAIVHTGGAGVFVDNSAMAHGRSDWLELAGDEEVGGVFWAFVATVGGSVELWSLGMHVLGFRDAIIPRTGDDEADHFALNNFLGYLCESEQTIVEGDLLGDEETALYRVRNEPAERFPPGSPLHNPYGLWRLEPVEDEQ